MIGAVVAVQADEELLLLEGIDIYGEGGRAGGRAGAHGCQSTLPQRLPPAQLRATQGQGGLLSWVTHRPGVTRLPCAGPFNWLAVSDHVGTKTPEQCRHHFYSIYIEPDSFPLPTPAPEMAGVGLWPGQLCWACAVAHVHAAAAAAGRACRSPLAWAREGQGAAGFGVGARVHDDGAPVWRLWLQIDVKRCADEAKRGKGRKRPRVEATDGADKAAGKKGRQQQTQQQGQQQAQQQATPSKAGPAAAGGAAPPASGGEAGDKAAKRRAQPKDAAPAVQQQQVRCFGGRGRGRGRAVPGDGGGDWGA
jgi:hypothetical protein